MPRGDGDSGTYSRADSDPFEAEIGATLDAIWAARAGKPTVVRVTDIYVPVYDQWKAAGIDDACTKIWEFYSDAVRDAAEAHGAVIVSAWDVDNGEDHDEDPVDKGYISDDGIHPAEAGSQAMAEALAAAGFEPTRPESEHGRPAERAHDGAPRTRLIHAATDAAGRVETVGTPPPQAGVRSIRPQPELWKSPIPRASGLIRT